MTQTGLTSLKAWGGGGVLGFMFDGYLPLASQSPYPIIVYFLANYRPHLSHFLENVVFVISTYSHFLFTHLPYQRGFKRRNVMRSMQASC